MPISDLFGLLAKRQTTPDKFLASSVNVVAGGREGAMRAPFSQTRGIQSYRSWVYAAATINANAVASLPLRLYAKKDATPLPTRAISRHRKAYMYGDLPGDARPSHSVMRKAVAYGDDFEEVTGSHPITDILAKANPFLNGFDLSVLRVLYGELTGNAYLHPIIDEATGLPAELWPLAPQFVEVIPDEDEFIRGYLYGIDSQRKQVFDRDEVIHFRRPNPGNLYYGLGKVEAAYGVIQANEAIHEMDLATFANSARPDYAVVVKGTPTGDQLDRFQQQVENRLRGTRKDGSFITVTGDVQFTPLNFPPKDLAGREEIVEEIAAVFGVPVSMLKANDPNLASATTGFAAWREGTILPLCRMDEEELNQTLLPLFGLEDTHCLAYDNPVPADRAYELTERQTAVAGGWRTPNEARIEEGREPIDDEFADRLLVNGQPIGGAAMGMGGLLSVDSPDPADSGGEAGPDLGFASSLLQSLRERRLSDYTVVKMLQGCGFPRSVAERMVEAEEKAIAAEDAAKRDKIHRMPDEPFDDCVERGIEVLTAEGYDRDQAVGMAYSMCEETKAIADVDLKPTEEMAALAERGLKLRKEHGRGGTEVGVARARDIKNRADLSPETVGRMANFFSRHRVDLDAPAADPDHEDYPSAGVIAWLLWGGDPANPDGAGAGWADRKMDELEAAEEKGYGCKNCGIGPDGFQSGNRCAEGGGGGAAVSRSSDERKKRNSQADENARATPTRISKEQAQEFTKNSVHKDVSQHVTRTDSAAAIQDGGFKVEPSIEGGTERFGRVLGDGVYLSTSEDTTQFYQNLGSSSDQSTIQTAVDIRNPLELSSQDAGSAIYSISGSERILKTAGLEDKIELLNSEVERHDKAASDWRRERRELIKSEVDAKMSEAGREAERIKQRLTEEQIYGRKMSQDEYNSLPLSEHDRLVQEAVRRVAGDTIGAASNERRDRIAAIQQGPRPPSEEQVRTSVVTRLLQEAGFDSIKFTEETPSKTWGGSQLVVFDPQRVKVIDD